MIEQSGKANGIRRKRSWVRTPPPEHTPSTEDWVRIAREMLISEGIVAVKIDRLAKVAGVTRGGFYWRFKSRDELLEALIEDWREWNTTPMLRVLQSDAPPKDRMRGLAELYIEGRGFSEAYDSAVRAWAALSPPIAEIVRAVDGIRLQALEELFRDVGFDADEAMIRARITYFHQVGYYAIGMQETAEDRWALVDRYTAVLFSNLMK
ncbi:TetR family transcriptional regulator [Sphingomonas sp. Root50]|nr:TetR family transcriptional regulator [Sphingomonas sp. Root1294]KQY67902.1 TetR family transcriptional regulator [Sphingomonas sp. Root50]KRB88827.1 TetR family transcriptional regulator [Sphingomonas sp. Root720]